MLARAPGATEYREDLRQISENSHVGIADREAAVQVFNRARVWLAPLLALSANSPFWLGEDTGYASYRTELWGRFPISGPPHTFASYDAYTALVGDTLRRGTGARRQREADAESGRLEAIVDRLVEETAGGVV